MTSVHSALDHRIFKKECRSLASAGFDVTVIGPHAKDGMEERVRIKSVKKYSSKLARMTGTVWRVYQEARKRDADIYHFHDPELMPIGLLLRYNGRKVIYDVHEDVPKDILFKDYLPRWSRPFVARAAAWLESRACRHFSAIVCVTPSIAERLRSVNKRTITLFNYPYAEELIDTEDSSWNSRKVAATYVGSISPQRGIAEMVHAMGHLSEKLGATLEIAGDVIPEEVKELSGWSRVRFHGVLDQTSTYQVLRSVRVGLVCEHPISTFLESMPVKIFEYMGAGLPIVASDFPLWRKMLRDVRCAVFVDPLDTKGIAQAIEYLLTNPCQAEEMGRRGQAAVAREFNWSTQAGKLFDLYSSLAKAPCAE